MIQDPQERVPEPTGNAPAHSRDNARARPMGADGWAWLIGEFGRAWHDAEAQATTAYEAWCRSPGVGSYAVYRAEQDRADAAQDALADWTRRVAALLRRSAGRPTTRGAVDIG